MNIKKMVAPIVAIMMVAAIFVTLAAAFTAPNADDDRVEFEYSEGNCDGLYVNERLCYPDWVPTLRIYGEDSYDAAFPYTDPEAPFDPTSTEAPDKDFVVFNPAYIAEGEYTGMISVSGANGREKVFVRQWYVPEYPEPRGDVWTSQSTVYSADIVTEYSYMLLNAQNMPAPGTAQEGTGAYWTHFWLPIGSDGDQIGLDSFKVEPSGTNRMVQLKAVGDFNSDGRKDIDVTTRDELFIDHADGWFQFLDHAIHVTDITYDSGGDVLDAVVDLYYIGNRNINEVTTNDLIKANLHLDIGGQQVVAGRHTHVNGGTPSFTLPWYLTVESVNFDGVYVTVGRLLHTGETFFVDGAEYDISMIYGPEDDEFKYITIRNPTPKCIPEVQSDIWLDDLSIGKECVPACTVMPMLPPFNFGANDGGYTMIDDIHLPNCYTDCPNEACDIFQDDTTNILDRNFDRNTPLEIMWVQEEIEPRFHTSLLEILKEPEEIWQWIHIHIMPDAYTEMCYPELPDANICAPWCRPCAQQLGDFLLVSSWEAPNSCGDRMKFAYDAADPTDIYVNEQYDDGTDNDRCGKNSVRVYGEGSKDAKFPYDAPEGPFNKLSADAPRKDFVTFNPAYLDEYDHNGVISVSGDNGREKVFVRQWYVPEYPEPRGDVWTSQATVSSADIVTEYSYMLLTAQNMPAPTTAQEGTGAYWTHFWLPIGSEGSQIGLDSFHVDVSDTPKDQMVQLKAVGDFNGDNRKDIDITTRDTLLVDHYGWFQFLDHAMKVTDIAYDSSGHVVKIVVDLYYIGNNNINEIDAGVLTEDLIVSNLNLGVGGQQVIAGRHTHIVGGTPSFTLPWYLEVESIGLNGVYLKVGRLLHTGETFFVDGAEYDVAMIYGPEADEFKYITIRNPTPKCIPGVQDDIVLEDLSVIKTCVSACEELPMLPPFNMDHRIVDDIGIPHYCPKDGGSLIYGDYIQNEPTGIPSCADTVEERILPQPGGQLEPPFVSYFNEELTELRFRTNLLEILNEGTTTESWNMLCILTLPDRYTAMVYPDVSDFDCGACSCCPNKCACCDRDADFLVTTSGPKIATPPDPDDCNPWDDDGAITASEIISAITLWSAQTPPAAGCDLLTANDIISMITTWSNQS